MTSVNPASAPLLSPSAIKYRLDEHGRVIWNLPENSVIVREFEIRGGKAVLVRQRFEVAVALPKSPDVDPVTGEILMYAVGRREPFRFGSTGASPRAGEPSGEER